MRVCINDIYDQEGDISPLMSDQFSGYKRVIEFMPGLSLTQQEISASEDAFVYEEAPAGVYFSLVGAQSITSSKAFDALQISFCKDEVAGEFELKAGETRSLMQIHFSSTQLANALNEPEENLMAFLLMQIQKISPKQTHISLPITDKSHTNIKALSPLQPERKLSLLGQVYAFAFFALEQMQTLSHMLSCTDCQSKLFTLQNLLETDIGIKKELTEFAYQTGLSTDAMELGFYHLVGQSVMQYQGQLRLKRAAAMIRSEQFSRSEIVAKTGLPEDQFETLFVKQFGVSTNQYGQIH